MNDLSASNVTGTPTPALSLSAFPPAIQRSLDPKSPVPVRMMAAKGLLACPPADLVSAIYLLTFDPDPKVADTARQTGATLQDKVLSGLRDEDLPAPVLDFYADQLRDHDGALEFIVLNSATSDETVARIASFASERVLEIVAQNQLRLLREESIVRALEANPQVRSSTRDAVLDFCVRSGMYLSDVPAFEEARRRVYGDQPEALPPEPTKAVEELLAEYGDAVRSESGQLAEDERLTFTQRVMRMTVSQKIKLATLGNKEARTILLRDSNKLVALAAVQSPRLSDTEIAALTNSRTLHEDVMRYVVRNREWLKNYQVKVNLVNNPKCPLATSIKLLQHLHLSELKSVARNKNIASTLSTQARMMLDKKNR